MNLKNIDIANQRIDRILSLTDVPMRRSSDWKFEELRHLLEEVKELLINPDADYTKDDVIKDPSKE